jgi:hypothetical protein
MASVVLLGRALFYACHYRLPACLPACLPVVQDLPPSLLETLRDPGMGGMDWMAAGSLTNLSMGGQGPRPMLPMPPPPQHPQQQRSSMQQSEQGVDSHRLHSKPPGCATIGGSPPIGQCSLLRLALLGLAWPDCTLD